MGAKSVVYSGLGINSQSLSPIGQNNIVNVLNCFGCSNFKWESKTFGVSRATSTKFKSLVQSPHSVYQVFFWFEWHFFRINNVWWVHDFSLLSFFAKIHLVVCLIATPVKYKLNEATGSKFFSGKGGKFKNP